MIIRTGMPRSVHISGFMVINRILDAVCDFSFTAFSNFITKRAILTHETLGVIDHPCIRLMQTGQYRDYLIEDALIFKPCPHITRLWGD